MHFYKIIKDDAVIDVGFVFLNWSEKHGCMIACDVSEAQFAQSSDELKAYHDNWLKPVPETYTDYEAAQVVIIEEDEYEELRARLINGETISPDDIEPEIIEPEPEEVTPDDEDKPLTIAEMRQIITEQQNKIKLLSDCLLEMSEIVYQ